MAVGYPVFGSRAIRADVAERVAARALSRVTADSPEEALESSVIASWLGCSVKEVPRLLIALTA